MKNRTILRYLAREEDKILMRFLVDEMFKVTLLCDHVPCGEYTIHGDSKDIYRSRYISHPKIREASRIILIFNDIFYVYLNTEPNTTVSFSVDFDEVEFPLIEDNFVKLFNSFVDKVYYINLDNRIDRNTRMRRQLKKLEIEEHKIQRFSAHKRNNGYLGSSMSHRDVLIDAKNNGYNNILVLEDDFQIRDFTLFQKQIIGLINSDIEYDVFMLEAYLNEYEQSEYEGIVRVFDAGLASAYLVNKNVYDRFVDTLNESVIKLKEGYSPHMYSNDHIRRPLQKETKWYAFEENSGYQSVGDSNLVKI